MGSWGREYVALAVHRVGPYKFDEQMIAAVVRDVINEAARRACTCRYREHPEAGHDGFCGSLALLAMVRDEPAGENEGDRE